MEENIESKDVKIILLGENGVGKTSIINRYIRNEFNPKNDTEALDSTFSLKEVKKSNIIYKLKIWDSTGQEEYHSVTKLFIKGSNIILLVFSLDSRESFEHLNYWYSLIKEILENDKYILAIIASKNDLKNEQVVSEDEGIKFAEDKKAFFRSVSSKEDGQGIVKLFDMLIDELSQTNFESLSESHFLHKKNLKKRRRQQCLPFGRHSLNSINGRINKNRTVMRFLLRRDDRI